MTLINCTITYALKKYNHSSIYLYTHVPILQKFTLWNHAYKIKGYHLCRGGHGHDVTFSSLSFLNEGESLGDINQTFITLIWKFSD